MPGVVLELEEYGLPRMITKKVHHCEVINFDNDMNIEEALRHFKRVGKTSLKEKLKFI